MALPPPAEGSIALITGAWAERLDAPCEELGGSERAVAIPADLTSPKDRDRVAARLEETGVTVEILVNDAGSGSYRDFVETPASGSCKPFGSMSRRSSTSWPGTCPRWSSAGEAP